MAARGSTSADELELDGGEELEQPEANEDGAKPKRTVVKAADLPADEKVSTMFGMPAGLKALVEAKAEAENVPTAEWLRKLVAAQFDYTLPEGTKAGRKSTYASEEEKIEARKKKGGGR